MLAQGIIPSVKLGGGSEASTFPRLAEGNYLIRVPFETVIVADDEELMEILDAADLLGQIPSSASHG
jgi:hypothetical protein